MKELTARRVKVSCLFLSLGQMRDTISTLKDGGAKCAYLAYNPEQNQRIPRAELDDFVGSVKTAKELAKAYGAPLVVGPGMRFMTSREGDYAKAAPYADVWVIQSQRFQIDRDTSKHATPEEYRKNVQRVVNLIHQGNPKTKVWVQIIICPGARAGNDFPAEEIVSLARAIEDIVDAVRIYTAGAAKGTETLKEVIRLLRANQPKSAAATPLPSAAKPQADRTPATTNIGPAVALNYTDDSEVTLAKHLRPGDRLAFMRQQVLDSQAWPAKAVALKQKTQAEVLVTWPSWQLAETNAHRFASHADVFGYDIESDSPRDETRDTAQTMKDMRAFLKKLAEKYKHPIRFSCGLNHSFGVTHLKDLAQADDLHIHCNGMLRDYPAKDKQGQNYVEWAVTTAQAVRQLNPKVGLWFGIYVPGSTVDKSIEVAQRISEEMQRLNMAFDGFTLWSAERRGSDSQTLNKILERIRPSLPQTVPRPAVLPKLGVNYVYHGMEQFIAARGGTREDYIARQNEKLQRIGPVWVRSAGKGDLTALHWATVEPRDAVFDFKLHDARVLDAQRRGLFMLGNVDFSDPPAHASVRGSYFDDAKYLRFLRTIIERYDGDGQDDMPGLTQPIRFWEIGNEPAVSKMFRGTPEQYAHVLKISSETIKANDPGATVLIGGLAIGSLREESIWQRALSFLDRILTADGGHSFDIMNYHEYTDDCDFLTYYHANGFKALLKKHGFEKPFWITEANTKLQKEGKGKYEGVSVRHSLERQAQDVIKRAIVAFDAGVDVFFWHRMDDIKGESLGVGLFDKDGQPKPIFYNLQLLATRLAGFRSIQRIKLKPDSLYLYKLDTDAGTEFIVWTESEDIAVDLSDYVNTSEVEMTQAITEAGKSQPVVKTVNKISVPATRTPAFARPIK